MNRSTTTFSSRIDRRSFLSCAAAIAGAASVGFAREVPAEFVEVKTSSGRLRGRRQGNLITFKGVPYAGPVAGPNRFKAAPPLQPWTGVRDALTLAPPNLQPGKDYFGVGEPDPQENCLFLNVWTPATDGRKRPVMFFNHGGGFSTGSGASVDHDGGNLARHHDVVVVETNHRLGLLGFLYLGDLAGEEYASSGNQGLLDMVDGLKWVHANIEAFGGDPANVMIFGESGGGAKTSCLYAMPAASNYFHKAGIESGAGLRMTPRDKATETTLMTLQELGIARSEWRKLLEVPADSLLAAQVSLGRRSSAQRAAGPPRPGGAGIGFGPVVDGTILPAHPFDPGPPAISKHKPILIGTNRDESAFMFLSDPTRSAFKLTDATLEERVQREYGKNAATVLDTYRKTRPGASPVDLYVAISTASMFWLNSITLAERKSAEGGAPVYMYMLTYQSNWVIPGTDHKLGSAHATDLLYTFDNIYPDGQWPPQGNATMYQMEGTGPGRFKVAKYMSEMFTSFARTSRPSAAGTPAWPPYTAKARETMMIDEECKVVADPFGEERRLWTRINAEA